MTIVKDSEKELCFSHIPFLSSQPVDMFLVSRNLSGSSEVQEHLCK